MRYPVYKHRSQIRSSPEAIKARIILESWENGVLWRDLKMF